jgi:hypothetical protein
MTGDIGIGADGLLGVKIYDYSDTLIAQSALNATASYL